MESAKFAALALPARESCQQEERLAKTALAFEFSRTWTVCVKVRTAETVYLRMGDEARLALLLLAVGLVAAGNEFPAEEANNYVTAAADDDYTTDDYGSFDFSSLTEDEQGTAGATDGSSVATSPSPSLDEAALVKIPSRIWIRQQLMKLQLPLRWFNDTHEVYCLRNFHRCSQEARLTVCQTGEPVEGFGWVNALFSLLNSPPSSSDESLFEAAASTEAKRTPLSPTLALRAFAKANGSLEDIISIMESLDKMAEMARREETAEAEVALPELTTDKTPTEVITTTTMTTPTYYDDTEKLGGGPLEYEEEKDDDEDFPVANSDFFVMSLLDALADAPSAGCPWDTILRLFCAKLGVGRSLCTLEIVVSPAEKAFCHPEQQKLCISLARACSAYRGETGGLDWVADAMQRRSIQDPYIASARLSGGAAAYYKCAAYVTTMTLVLRFLN